MAEILAGRTGRTVSTFSLDGQKKELSIRISSLIRGIKDFKATNSAENMLLKERRGDLKQLYAIRDIRLPSILPVDERAAYPSDELEIRREKSSQHKEIREIASILDGIEKKWGKAFQKNGSKKTTRAASAFFDEQQ